jgi:hypothetical protein
MQLGDEAEAESYFELSAKTDPAYWDPCVELALIYGARKESERLSPYLARALTLDADATVEWYRNHLEIFLWLSGEPGFFRGLLLSIGAGDQNERTVGRLLEMHGLEVDLTP